jgi:hypothetical protein
VDNVHAGVMGELRWNCCGLGGLQWDGGWVVYSVGHMEQKQWASSTVWQTMLGNNITN